MNCPTCNNHVNIIAGPYGPHAAKAKCPKCGWMKWVSRGELGSIDPGEVKKVEKQDSLF